MPPEKRPDRLLPLQPPEAEPSPSAGREAEEAAHAGLLDKAEQAWAEQAKLRAKISLAQAQRDDRAETVQALGGKAASVELANLVEGSGTNSKIPAAALEGLIAEAFETSRNE